MENVKNTETLEETVREKAPKTTPKPPIEPRRIRRPRPETTPADDLKNVVEWFDLKAIKRQRTKEEPLQVMIYYRLQEYKQSKKRNLKNYSKQLQRHGKITFSHFLSNKYGLNCKVKFGALDGKLIFQVNKLDGITPKLASTSTAKICVSCADVVEIIYNKYGLQEGSHSVYFKLEDLGNDFYLIDKIIK